MKAPVGGNKASTWKLQPESISEESFWVYVNGEGIETRCFDEGSAVDEERTGG